LPWQLPPPERLLNRNKRLRLIRHPPIMTHSGPDAAKHFRVPGSTPPPRSVAGSTVVCPNKIGPYLLQNAIGEGGFSVVRTAVHEETNETFACKVIPRRRLAVLGLESQLNREVDILKSLRHPSICSLYEVLYDTINCYVIMELCPQGSLRERIIAQEKLPESQAKGIFRQLLEAVAYIHERRLAHRDIKPENIMIDDSDQIKLIDFGLSNFQGEDGLFATRVGSTGYAAPECFGRERYDGYKCDTWSCGVVLFTMLTGGLPWVCHNDQKMIDQICSCSYFLPLTLSTDAKDLIEKILKLDTEERYSATQILGHSWFSGMPSPEVRRRSSMPQRGIKISASQPLCLLAGSSGSSRMSGAAMMLIQKGNMHRQGRAQGIARPPPVELSFNAGTDA
jgi:serine/threonine protein kinase